MVENELFEMVREQGPHLIHNNRAPSTKGWYTQAHTHTRTHIER